MDQNIINASELDFTMIDKLAEVVLTNVPEAIVEIGTAGSTMVLSRHAKNFVVCHYACDTRPGMCIWARANNCSVFEGRSTDFIEQFPDIPVSLVVVNNVQTSLPVLDFFLKKLAYSGMIFLRDHIIVQEWLKRQTFLTEFNLQTFVWPYTDVRLMMIMKNAIMTTPK